MIDPRRLARAVHLDCDPLPDGRWRVSGGARDHLVAEDPRGLVCDCWDANGGRVCKHQLRVRLTLGDAETLLAMRELVPMPTRRTAAA